ncbi:hypothetical protein H9651_12945 [Microbacterium sp. Sa4CUA7]|uniref:Uncharacterized protein n=1 Tax=Microbacterium pullorum TaxID=2762236 RepID=A0ABR8S523_9MICO|nr:DUF6492 family protein [Microbacterium pullorum]MBD7958550.1 hypothetical protein [Microbacterium pullorum]
MTRQSFEIVTPSYARDFELCRELVRSCRAYGPPGIAHTIVVPPRDLTLFAPLRASGASIITTRSMLPRSFAALPGMNAWVNVRRPFPPVRGWIAQQIIKLATVARSHAGAVLIVDSDIEFVRPFSLETFLVDGRIPLYRLPHAVSDSMPRHILWDDVAHRMLGLAPRSLPTRPDFISWPSLWEPAVVRDLLERVSAVAGVDWPTAIARELHFSEMVLYGVFSEQARPRDEHLVVTEDMHCVSISDERTLDRTELSTLFDRLMPADVAVMVSAKSGTDMETRRAGIAAIARRFD